MNNLRVTLKQSGIGGFPGDNLFEKSSKTYSYINIDK